MFSFLVFPIQIQTEGRITTREEMVIPSHGHLLIFFHPLSGYSPLVIFSTPKQAPHFKITEKGGFDAC